MFAINWMPRTLAPLLGAAILAWSGLYASAHAAVLFNAPANYQNGYCYISGCASYQAENFTLSTASTIDQFSFVELVSNLFTPPTTTVDWQVLSTNSSGAPGAVIASASNVTTTATFDRSANGWNFYNIGFSVPSLSLAAGTYYLALNVAPGSYYWATSNVGDSTAYVTNGNGWSAFSPASYGSGFALAVSGTTTGAVPEPTTWALMILGFGSAGAMLRRRRGLAALHQA
jgi:hypothetical protein